MRGSKAKILVRKQIRNAKYDEDMMAIDFSEKTLNVWEKLRKVAAETLFLINVCHVSQCGKQRKNLVGNISLHKS